MTTQTSALRNPVDPPRIDLWPAALQSAERLRGTILPCGPGFRGVGWPETPRVRLAALAPWLAGGRIATHLTAAWVWGAARSPGHQLQVSVRNGHRGLTRRDDEVRVHGMRARRTDVHYFGEFAVTTPRRTLIDLLHSADDFGAAERVSCRLLIRIIETRGDEAWRDACARPRPGCRLARERFASLTSGI